MTEFSRRDMLRAAAMGALGLSVPAVLAACGSGGGSTAASAPRPTAPPTTLPFDPSKKWWLQGNFAPVMHETEAFHLAVEGTIPPELNGLYVRNGSNPQASDSQHWFFGDGMVHGVALSNGKAEWYRNRYVRTRLYLDKQSFGDAGAPGGTSTQSNVSAFTHAGKLLTSGEVGYPFQLDTNLDTVGIYDFAGKLTTSCTAHPKIDPQTGEMHFFGYGFTPPYLTYHVADAQGRLVSSQEVAVARSTMIHDFAITDRDVVFWELPVVFDLVAATQWIKDPNSGAFPYQWRPEVGARIGVMPLGGPASAIKWYEIDPCYVFHGVNAYRDGAKVVIDVCRLSSMFAPHQTLGGELSLRRWTVDTASGSVSDDVIEEHGIGELPNRDLRRVGRKHRYGYFVQNRHHVETVDFGGLIKHDYDNGTHELWDPGPNLHTGEWLFVPAGADLADDAGYLLTYDYDAGHDRSHLLIVDATAVRRGPIARVALPQRVPYGFHATWVSAERA